MQKKETDLEWEPFVMEGDKVKVWVGGMLTRTMNRLAGLEMAEFIAFGHREAEVTINRHFVARHGAGRSVWLLREELCQTRYFLPLWIEKYLDDLLEDAHGGWDWGAEMVG